MKIERESTLGASLSAPIVDQRLISLDVDRAPEATAERALVPLSRVVCPDCGAMLVEHVAVQLPLLRHGGYGEAQRTVRRVCSDCGWTLTAERGSVKP